MRTGIRAIVDFMGPPWVRTDVIVSIEEGRHCPAGVHIVDSHIIITTHQPQESWWTEVIYHELAHYYFHPRTLNTVAMVEGAAEFMVSYILHVTENADLQERYRSTSSSVRSCGQNIYGWLQSHRPEYKCAYSLGERFLLGMYNSLGHDVVQSSLRELHRIGTSRFYGATEEEIYQVFLSNTPEAQRDEFIRLYRELHGGPLGYTVGILSEEVLASTEGQALVALYNAANGANWTTGQFWFTEAPLDQWPGVSIDDDGRVVALFLGDNGLAGTIPPELGNLGDLRQLDLSSNQLTGPVPPELGDLVNLMSLHLAANRLTGPLPPELGNLGNLRFLGLSSNRIDGPIPPDLGNLSNLAYLALDYNGFTGPVPPELGGLSGLESLVLNQNQLTGPIPPELGRLPSLRSLYITGNGITGCIPQELGGLEESDLEHLGLPVCGEGTVSVAASPTPEMSSPSGVSVSTAPGVEEALAAFYNATDGPNWRDNSNWLTDAPLDQWYGVMVDPGTGQVVSLELSGNSLAGPLPPELGGLSHLRGASLRGNFLTGPIPPEIGSLSHLSYLDISDNRLTGEIPHELGTLSQLKGLFLSDNQLTGTIPYGFRNLSNLRTLDLSRNQLKGIGGPELGNLANLRRLSLQDNSLEGHIPEFGGLVSLEYLNLSNNRLVGVVPPQLGSLANLKILSLDKNLLEGEIPSELGNLRSLERLGLSNNLLEGRIPPELGNLSNLKSLSLSGNGFTGCIPAGLSDKVGYVQLPDC